MMLNKAGGKMIIDPWFTIKKIDDFTFAIGEYGHWEKVHSFFINWTKTIRVN